MNEYLKDRLKAIVQESLANLSADVNQIVDEMPKFDRYQALQNELASLRAENARLQSDLNKQHERNYLLVRQLERRPQSTDLVLGGNHGEFA